MHYIKKKESNLSINIFQILFHLFNKIIFFELCIERQCVIRLYVFPRHKSAGDLSPKRLYHVSGWLSFCVGITSRVTYMSVIADRLRVKRCTVFHDGYIYHMWKGAVFTMRKSVHSQEQPFSSTHVTSSKDSRKCL